MDAALFAIVPTEDQRGVIAYGIEITNDENDIDVVVFRRDPDTRRTEFSVHDSIERTKTFYSRFLPIELVWLD